MYTFQTLKGSLQTDQECRRRSGRDRFQTLKGSLQTLCHFLFSELIEFVSNPQRIATNCRRKNDKEAPIFSFKPSKDRYKLPTAIFWQLGIPRFKPSKDRYKLMVCKGDTCFEFLFQTLKGSLQTNSSMARSSLDLVCFKPSKDRYKPVTVRSCRRIRPVSNPQRIATNVLLWIRHFFQYFLFQTLKGSLQTTIKTIRNSWKSNVSNPQRIATNLGHNQNSEVKGRFQTLKGSLQTSGQKREVSLIVKWVSNPQRIATNLVGDFIFGYLILFQTLKGSLQTHDMDFQLALVSWVSNPQRIATNLQGQKYFEKGLVVSNPQRIATNPNTVKFGIVSGLSFKPSKDRYKQTWTPERWAEETLVSNPQRIATNQIFLFFYLGMSNRFKPSKDRYKHVSSNSSIYCILESFKPSKDRYKLIRNWK